jgi:hypothetical protein
MEDLIAAVPAYRDLVIDPEVASIAAALQRLQAGDPAQLVQAARAHVLAHNSLDAFAQAWRARCEATVTAPTRAPEG